VEDFGSGTVLQTSYPSILGGHSPQATRGAVGDLTAVAGLSRPATAHHLMLLRRAGVVGRRRAGQRTFYRLMSARAAELLRDVGEG